MRESDEWVYLRRRTCDTKTGGGHVKIDSVTLNEALDFAEIPKNIPLKVKRYPVKDVKGTAKIILKIKPVTDNTPLQE